MEGEREPEGLQTQENTPPAHAFTDGTPLGGSVCMFLLRRCPTRASNESLHGASEGRHGDHTCMLKYMHRCAAGKKLEN